MYPKINKMASIRCLPPKINNIAPKINHCCFGDHDDHDYGDLDWGDHGNHGRSDIKVIFDNYSNIHIKKSLLTAIHINLN